MDLINENEVSASWAEIDARIDRLEALVLKALCKCSYDLIGNRYFNGCPLHNQMTMMLAARSTHTEREER